MKLAIVGTGIAGMTAAHVLHRDHDLTIFEAGAYIGGHTNTVDVDLQGTTYAIDTGLSYSTTGPTRISWPCWIAWVWPHSRAT